MYNFITCPNTGKIFPINHEDGLNIINNYLQHGGGRIEKNITEIWTTIRSLPPPFMEKNMDLDIKEDILKSLPPDVDKNDESPLLKNWRSMSDLRKICLKWLESYTLSKTEDNKIKFLISIKTIISDSVTNKNQKTSQGLDGVIYKNQKTSQGLDGVLFSLEIIKKKLIEFDFSYNNWKLLIILDNLHTSILDENENIIAQSEEIGEYFKQLLEYKEFLENLGQDKELVSAFTFRFNTLVSPIYKMYIKDRNRVLYNLSEKNKIQDPIDEYSAVDYGEEEDQNYPEEIDDLTEVSEEQMNLDMPTAPFIHPVPFATPIAIPVRGGSVQKGGGSNIPDYNHPLKMSMLTDALQAGNIEGKHDFAGPLRTKKSSSGNKTLFLGSLKFIATRHELEKQNNAYFKNSGEQSGSDNLVGWNKLICGAEPLTNPFTILCDTIPPLKTDTFNLSELYNNSLKYSNNRTQIKLVKDKKGYLKNFLAPNAILENRSFNLFSFSPLFLEEIAVNNYSEDDLRLFYKSKLTFIGTQGTKKSDMIIIQLKAFLEKVITLRENPLFVAAKALLKSNTAATRAAYNKAVIKPRGSPIPSQADLGRAKRKGRQSKFNISSNKVYDFFSNAGITGYTIDGDPAGGSGIEREFFMGTGNGLKNLLTQYNTAACVWDPRNTSILNMTGDFRAGIIPYDSFASSTRRRLAVSMDYSGDLHNYWGKNNDSDTNIFPKDSLLRQVGNKTEAIDIRFNLYYNTEGQDWQNIIGSSTHATSFIPMKYYPHGRDSIILPKKYFPPWTDNSAAGGGALPEFEYIGFIYGLPGVDWLKIINFICFNYIIHVTILPVDSPPLRYHWGGLYTLWETFGKSADKTVLNTLFGKGGLRKKGVKRIKNLLNLMWQVLQQPNQKKNQQNIPVIIKFISRVIDEGLTALGDDSGGEYSDQRINLGNYITKMLHDLKCSGDRGIVKSNRHLYFKDGIRLLHMANDLSAIICSTFNCRGSIAAGTFYTIDDTTPISTPITGGGSIISDFFKISNKFTQKTFKAGFFATNNSHDLNTDIEIDSNNQVFDIELYEKIREKKKEIAKNQIKKFLEREDFKTVTTGMDDATEKDKIIKFIKEKRKGAPLKWLLGNKWDDEVSHMVDYVFEIEEEGEDEGEDEGDIIAISSITEERLVDTKSALGSVGPVVITNKADLQKLPRRRSPRLLERALLLQQGGALSINSDNKFSELRSPPAAEILNGTGSHSNYYTRLIDSDDGHATPTSLVDNPVYDSFFALYKQIEDIYNPSPVGGGAGSDSTNKSRQMFNIVLEIKNEIVESFEQTANIQTSLIKPLDWVDDETLKLGICKDCLNQKLSFINISVPEEGGGEWSTMDGMCAFCSLTTPPPKLESSSLVLPTTPIYTNFFTPLMTNWKFRFLPKVPADGSTYKKLDSAIPIRQIISGKYSTIIEDNITEFCNLLGEDETHDFKDSITLVYNLSIITALLIECNELAIKIFTCLPPNEDRKLPFDQSIEIVTKHNLTSLRSEAWCDSCKRDGVRMIPLFINQNWWQKDNPDGPRPSDLCQTCHTDGDEYTFIRTIEDIQQKEHYLYTLDELKEFKYVDIFMSMFNQLETFIKNKIRLLETLKGELCPGCVEIPEKIPTLISSPTTPSSSSSTKQSITPFNLVPISTREALVVLLETNIRIKEAASRPTTATSRKLEKALQELTISKRIMNYLKELLKPRLFLNVTPHIDIPTLYRFVLDTLGLSEQIEVTLSALGNMSDTINSVGGQTKERESRKYLISNQEFISDISKGALAQLFTEAKNIVNNNILFNDEEDSTLGGLDGSDDEELDDDVTPARSSDDITNIYNIFLNKIGSEPNAVKDLLFINERINEYNEHEQNLISIYLLSGGIKTTLNIKCNEFFTRLRKFFREELGNPSIDFFSSLTKLSNTSNASDVLLELIYLIKLLSNYELIPPQNLPSPILTKATGLSPLLPPDAVHDLLMGQPVAATLVVPATAPEEVESATTLSVSGAPEEVESATTASVSGAPEKVESAAGCVLS